MARLMASLSLFIGAAALWFMGRPGFAVWWVACGAVLLGVAIQRALSR